jgi:hypothetical protein
MVCALEEPFCRVVQHAGRTSSGEALARGPQYETDSGCSEIGGRDFLMRRAGILSAGSMLLKAFEMAVSGSGMALTGDAILRANESGTLSAGSGF